jgi:hypothetical protein
VSLEMQLNAVASADEKMSTLKIEVANLSGDFIAIVQTKTADHVARRL